MTSCRLKALTSILTPQTTNHFFSNTQTTNKNPMARYRRNFIAGGTFFFTVKLADPKSRLLVEHIDLLRAAYMDVQKQYPFETVAVCVLSNHIHAIWMLRLDGADYSTRNSCPLVKNGGTNAVSGNSIFTNIPL